MKNTIKPIMSLEEKFLWNSSLSTLELTPKGFEDPVECKKKICTITPIKTTKGKRKWKVKNRVKVGPLTENPPHNHITISVPKYGTAWIKLVITLAPQNDIWPQGKTYPKKAEPITKRNKDEPDIQAWFNEYLE